MFISYATNVQWTFIFFSFYFVLTGLAGWLPSRLRKDLTWNRTVNLTGGPGRNLAMDLVNEFLNNEFKGMHLLFKS